jgi:hypothetical protein
MSLPRSDSQTFEPIKIDEAFAKKAAEKYRDRAALVADVQQWRSLSIMLREGLHALVKEATADVEKLRTELETERQNYDKERKKYSYQVSAAELVKLEALIEGTKAVIKETLEEYYAIFGRKSDDYIVRDQGMNSDVKALQKSTKEVKTLYKLLERARLEAETGKRKSLFGEEADYLAGRDEEVVQELDY